MDSFGITVIFFVIAALVAAFTKGRSKDKCLRSFAGDLITMELLNGKVIWGKLVVDVTGLEFLYPKVHKDNDGHDEKSYIFYKPEYDSIQVLVRFLDELDQKSKKTRDKELKRIYHPNISARINRSIVNCFKTVRDAFVELFNLLIDQAKKKAPGGAILASQGKYVSSVQKDVIGITSTAYDPILERYIGKHVVIEFFKAQIKHEYSGVLKDYTADFIELMEVDYSLSADARTRKADVVLPRKLSVVRHAGE